MSIALIYLFECRLQYATIIVQHIAKNNAKIPLLPQWFVTVSSIFKSETYNLTYSVLLLSSRIANRLSIDNRLFCFARFRYTMKVTQKIRHSM